ncbi:MAG: hypothetical protein J5606_08970 [Bacteroidales bacterium]|nr:hypothetical protein [Bacteroidales bacterium]
MHNFCYFCIKTKVNNTSAG